MEAKEFKEPKVIDRIARLKAALFYRPREISLERALLYTESHRQTEGEHVQLRRAKAAAHVLRKVAISIRDDELIAGNRTIKPRAGTTNSMRTQPVPWFVMVSMRPLRAARSWVIAPRCSSGASIVRCSNGS